MNSVALRMLPLLFIAIVFSVTTERSSAGTEAAVQKALPQSRIDDKISVQQAYELSIAKKLHLIDIRRPEEWQETGVATTARAITMHQSIFAFLRELRKISPSLAEQPIALICARGLRSRYMQRILRRYGAAHVVDVSEGMLGSADGPGWLKSNLPIKHWAPN